MTVVSRPGLALLTVADINFEELLELLSSPDSPKRSWFRAGRGKLTKTFPAPNGKHEQDILWEWTFTCPK